MSGLWSHKPHLVYVGVITNTCVESLQAERGALENQQNRFSFYFIFLYLYSLGTIRGGNSVILCSCDEWALWDDLLSRGGNHNGSWEWFHRYSSLRRQAFSSKLILLQKTKQIWSIFDHNCIYSHQQSSKLHQHPSTIHKSWCQVKWKNTFYLYFLCDLF